MNNIIAGQRYYGEESSSVFFLSIKPLRERIPREKEIKVERTWKTHTRQVDTDIYYVVRARALSAYIASIRDLSWPRLSRLVIRGVCGNESGQSLIFASQIAAIDARAFA